MFERVFAREDGEKIERGKYNNASEQANTTATTMRDYAQFLPDAVASCEPQRSRSLVSSTGNARLNQLARRVGESGIRGLEETGVKLGGIKVLREMGEGEGGRREGARGANGCEKRGEPGGERMWVGGGVRGGRPRVVGEGE